MDIGGGGGRMLLRMVVLTVRGGWRTVQRVCSLCRNQTVLQLDHPGGQPLLGIELRNRRGQLGLHRADPTSTGRELHPQQRGLDIGRGALSDPGLGKLALGVRRVALRSGAVLRRGQRRPPQLGQLVIQVQHLGPRAMELLLQIPDRPRQLEGDPSLRRSTGRSPLSTAPAAAGRRPPTPTPSRVSSALSAAPSPSAASVASAAPIRRQHPAELLHQPFDTALQQRVLTRERRPRHLGLKPHPTQLLGPDFEHPRRLLRVDPCGACRVLSGHPRVRGRAKLRNRRVVRACAPLARIGGGRSEGRRRGWRRVEAGVEGVCVRGLGEQAEESAGGRGPALRGALCKLSLEPLEVGAGRLHRRKHPRPRRSCQRARRPHRRLDLGNPRLLLRGGREDRRRCCC
eukprot:m.469118 g.469118  ORF g.469118 m.469118 type:complete len:400 (+) comp28130_c0_seq1:616-1815(+)